MFCVIQVTHKLTIAITEHATNLVAAMELIEHRGILHNS